MSLNVYLEGPQGQGKEPCHCVTCGHEHETTFTEIYYDANITHNLTKMAVQAGIYECLWRPEAVNITTAQQLIEPLKDGLAIMKAEPERFKKFNAENGWGRYDHFVPWIERYLLACQKYPNATVRVSR